MFKFLKSLLKKKDKKQKHLSIDEMKNIIKDGGHVETPFGLISADVDGIFLTNIPFQVKFIDAESALSYVYNTGLRMYGVLEVAMIECTDKHGDDIYSVIYKKQ